MQSNGLDSRITKWALVALFGAMLADLGEFLVDPASSDKAGKIYAAASAHHGRMIASAAFLLISAALIVPALFGLARLMRERGKGLGIAARVLAVLGSMGHTGLAAMYLIWAELPSSHAEPAQMIAAIDRVVNSSSLGMLFPLIIAFPLALVVFFAGTVRARITPRWLLVPVLAAPVVAGASETAALVILIGCATVLGAGLLRTPEPASGVTVSATAPA
jgi:hypothetical protein